MLKRSNYFSNNNYLDKTFIYCYDNIGNITGVEEYAYSEGDLPESANKVVSYIYNTTHPDRLTNFNGKSINYDTLGRVSYYDGKNYNWSDGRLSSFGCGSASQSGTLYDSCIFTYDGYGRRTRKQHIYDVNPGATSDYSYTETRDYTYDNSGRLIREYYTNQFTYSGAGAPTTKEFIFLYDESSVIGVRYINNGASTTDYYYVKNLQGDVTAIYDTNGNLITEYAYDAYGNCTVIYGNSSEISRINPIRYRSYYYDTDTGLYYFNARYYRPEWRRFISPDDTAYLDYRNVNGLNLYGYANNNPISFAFNGSSAERIVGGVAASAIDSGSNAVLNRTVVSKGRLLLPEIPWLVENATTIHGMVSSLSAGIPISYHYFKYASIIKDEFRLYGISKWKTSLQLADVSLKIGALDGVLIGVNVLIDMYDSYQRGVSAEGILLGGVLTAASGVVMFYLDKGIMWATTTIGTAICPGIGTAIGFTVGLVGSILVDIFLGEWVAYLIDENIT